ncbi:TetR/AcrR family transcriptional regulator [Actinomadura sp. HBU206391]|uniref:TetR/AcrR family transcriptional regulator n=1 Tax=Actinomadura sp. HBU206391 TaxID=2731692 RepID=UPI00164F3C6D|nr:TetR/AcrR family transcriptional regulator [Actinomadura sp. HBU206391]MBC6461070.1 TetR/AcrR family transcriptional regulator [Actinomadura sp. HBU206391]
MKPIAQPANARSRRTKAAILAATRALMEEEGFETLTMAAVADRADVSRRGVYLHFGSRTELITALFHYVNETEDLDGSLRPVWAAPDAVAALDEWARHLARYHTRMIPFARAIERVRHADADAARHWDLVLRHWHTCCRRLADRLAAEGRLNPAWTADSAADMLWALMSFDVLEGLLDGRGWSREEYADRLGTLLLSTFATADPSGTADPPPAGGSRSPGGDPRS